METLREQSGVLVVERCWCGIQHAVPQSLRDMQIQQHRDGRMQQGIYCPLGHKWLYSGEAEVDRVKRRMQEALNAEQAATQRERQRHDQTRAELRETEARRRGEKAAKTRIKNRVSKGVCPCCNRHFENLQRHMTGQHSDFVKAD